jgi:hypothetical protein
MVQSRIKDFGDMSSSSTAKERTVLRFINRFGLMLIVMLVACQSNQAAVFAQESIPETPAGKLMAQLIDAINDDDEDVRMAFWKEGFAVNDEEAVEQRQKRTDMVRSRLGKITFKQVINSTEMEIRAMCDTAVGPIVEFAISVGEAPHKIKTIALEIARENPRMGNDKEFELDAETRSALLEKLVSELRAKYVLPEVGEELATAVEESKSSGDYQEINDIRVLASHLTRQLRDLSGDKDIFLYAGPPQDVAQQRKRRAADSHGFVKVEILPGRIGYLKFNHFSGDKEARENAAAVMRLLSGSDALILDLRENGGGDADMIAYLSSYLFDDSVHLNSMYDRETDTTKETWSLKEVPGVKFSAEIPVYLLTGKFTFAGAEEFAYSLQSLQRAVVVGEPTAGNAHYTEPLNLGDRLQISMPNAKAINPVTKTNWEGVGVKPDVKVPANQALDKARELITGEPIRTAKKTAKEQPSKPPKKGGFNKELDALIEKAEGLLEEESYREAAVVFAEMTSSFPNNPAAWFRYGFCLHMSGDLDRAIEVHRKAAEFDQFATMATYNLACAYALKGQSDDAFEALQKAILLGFNDVAQFKADTDWEKLRNDRRFERLLENMKRDQ